ncbi:MAG: ferredoxin [Candidatus Diapherotrites archaeon]
MPDFKIQHDRTNCIGCGACAAVAPDYWEMSPADGKSDLKESKHTKEGDQIVLEEREITQEKYANNKEAADSCPVNVIHLFDKNGKKII